MPNANAVREVVAPFIKWAGGKRWLTKVILEQFPKHYRNYYEPFLGGGAVFFALQPHAALITDLNAELVNAYVQVRDRPHTVIDRLQSLTIDRDAYYALRAAAPTAELDRAVRFLYLNRTAWNGLYRVNRQGKFNVPFGCKPGTKLCEPSALMRASEALHGIAIRCCDYTEALADVTAGDLVYLDPPYTVRHDTNGFRRYNEAIFTWEHQVRLADSAQRMRDRGAFVAVSNAHHEDVKSLYPRFRAVEVDRVSCIGGRQSSRGPVQEYLFIST